MCVLVESEVFILLEEKAWKVSSHYHQREILFSRYPLWWTADCNRWKKESLVGEKTDVLCVLYKTSTIYLISLKSVKEMFIADIEIDAW